MKYNFKDGVTSPYDFGSATIASIISFIVILQQKLILEKKLKILGFILDTIDLFHLYFV